MKTLSYKTRGTCSREIRVCLDDNDVIESVEFVGGCDGNTHGIMSLVRGMSARQVIGRVEGIKCGMKDTSCPDQLAQALKQML